MLHQEKSCQIEGRIWYITHSSWVICLPFVVMFGLIWRFRKVSDAELGHRAERGRFIRIQHHFLKCKLVPCKFRAESYWLCAKKKSAQIQSTVRWRSGPRKYQRVTRRSGPRKYYQPNAWCTRQKAYSLWMRDLGRWVTSRVTGPRGDDLSGSCTTFQSLSWFPVKYSQARLRDHRYVIFNTSRIFGKWVTSRVTGDGGKGGGFARILHYFLEFKFRVEGLGVPGLQVHCQSRVLLFGLCTEGRMFCLWSTCIVWGWEEAMRTTRANVYTVVFR